MVGDRLAVRCALALLVLTAPGCAARLVEPGVETDPVAEERADRWFREAYAFDALLSYEMRVDGDDFPLRFSVARRWDGRSIEMLAQPDQTNALSFLASIDAAGRVDSFIYSRSGVTARRVRRIRQPFNPADDSWIGLASEVTLPRIRPELAHAVLIGPEAIGGVGCERLVLRPRVRTGNVTRVELCLLPERGLALETSYWKGEQLLRRVRVDPERIIERPGGGVPAVLRIDFARGAGAEIELLNHAFDVALPDTLFTTDSLRRQRFPEF